MATFGKILPRQVLPDQVLPRAVQPHSALPWITACAVITGSLDLVAAAIWWTPQGLAPVRILQSVAAWVLGRDLAFGGGPATAAFGLVVQCAIMAVAAALYFRIARLDVRLRRQPLRWGASYGAIVYAIQHLLLVPYFSALAPAPLPRLDWMLACLVVYVTLVGIPCALFARAYAQQR